MTADSATHATRIRRLRPEDRDAVVAIIEDTELFSEAEKAVATEVLDSYYLNPGKDYHALGAFTPRGTLLGYACYGPTPCTTGTWDLYWIAVSREARGRRIGTHLMERIERRLRRLHARLLVIETSSRPDYAPTRAFYEGRGYAIAARVSDFYAPGDDRVIYTRNPSNG